MIDWCIDLFLHEMINKMIELLTDWLTDWLIEWLSKLIGTYLILRIASKTPFVVIFGAIVSSKNWSKNKYICESTN